MKKTFIYIFLVFLIHACNLGHHHSITSENFEFIELGEGVYSCIHKIGGKAICNVGVVDNGHETIIFDSFLTPEVAKELIHALKKLHLSPIKYVVNSHFHNDHIRGNQVFSRDVKIISTHKTKELIEEEEPEQLALEKEKAPALYEEYDSLFQAFEGDTLSREYQKLLMWRPYYETLANSHEKVKTRVPDMLIDSTLNLDGHDRKIQLISMGEGHSESDLILYLPEDKILFTGDLVFNKCHPYVPHGNIASWKTWLDFMGGLDVELLMPGHGDMGNAGTIDQMKDYLESLENRSQQLIAKGITVDSLDSIAIPAIYENWWFDRFYAPNLRFALASLSSNENE